MIRTSETEPRLARRRAQLFADDFQSMQTAVLRYPSMRGVQRMACQSNHPRRECNQRNDESHDRGFSGSFAHVLIGRLSPTANDSVMPGRGV